MPGTVPRLRSMPEQPRPSAVATYHHVDVFADRPYSGNSLAVFVDPPTVTADQMSAIARELRHFETVFVRREGEKAVARVFDLVRRLSSARPRWRSWSGSSMANCPGGSMRTGPTTSPPRSGWPTSSVTGW